MRIRRCFGAVLSAVVLVASFGLVTPAAAGPAGDAPSAAVRAALSTASTVTLITGDRVSLLGTGQAVIHHRPDREHVAYLSQRIGDDLYVIPTDALPLLQSGQLDWRLFNVSLLVEFGYHQRPDLPLIVVDGGVRAAAASLATADGVEVVQDLPAIGGSAVRVDRSALDAFWGDLVGRSAGIAAAGASKVWLDGLRRPLLEESVPQVGALQAWAAGLDGSGVTVAVVDTGIDATHPDLADRVVASANFTEGAEEDGDLVGHGTHVASIIAGSGAASEGRLRGVAPGADLLDAKVCAAEFGCHDSWIVAGMQWAVEQGADVINVSLGGPDTPEVDPVEQAIEELTAEFGVLFVVSAGNDWSDRSINSPGSADSALTVGAVDKADELAEFSSRGPRVDGALKPDLTAPGVGVVAANSSTGFLGEPGQAYTTQSGTSMAAPHVAGAAAILRQQHPDWSPAQLKAALMGSATPHPALSPYAQGAGRLDVARAISQTVVADPPSVSFAPTAWPHDDDEPQTATVTYRNDGPVDVTLSLELSTHGPGGGPAPDGFFTLSDTTVTVPAGGSAQVTLTVDTSVGEVDGLFGGHLTAVGPDVRVTVPFAVEREIEAYDVTLSHTGRDGQPADYLTFLLRTDQFDVVTVFGAPTATVRVPVGEYVLVSFVVGAGEEPERTLMAQPRLVVDSDVTVEVDARLAGPISVTVPAADASLVGGSASVGVVTDNAIASFGLEILEFGTVFSGHIGPDDTVPGFFSSVTATFARPDAEGFFSASPYTYDVAFFESGRMMTGLHRDLKRRDLARVVADHVEHVPGSLGVKFSTGMLSEAAGGVAIGFATELPFRRIEYHNTDGGIVWRKSLLEIIPADAPGAFPEFLNDTSGHVTAYQAPRTYHETWNKGVFGPGLPEPGPFRLPAVARTGDELWLLPQLFNDVLNREVVSLTSEERLAVFRDGELVAEVSGLATIVEVPAEEATYRVEAEAVRDERFPSSTHVSLAWTFRSGHVDGTTMVPLPVSVVRFTPTLDERNTAPAGRTFLVPVQVLSQGGAGPLVDLTVEVSYDDGQTWQEVPVLAGRMLLLRHPTGDGYVSLRASGADADGNTVEQTIIRAYRFTSGA